MSDFNPFYCPHIPVINMNFSNLFLKMVCYLTKVCNSSVLIRCHLNLPNDVQLACLFMLRFSSSGLWLFQSMKNAIIKSHSVTSTRYQANYVNVILFWWHYQISDQYRELQLSTLNLTLKIWRQKYFSM